MGLRVGLDFGTTNSGVAVFDGKDVNLLAIDRGNVLPEVVKTILYITRDFQVFIGQEAIELYYKHNVNRIRRFEKKWAGEIEVIGGDMYFVRDVFVDVDIFKPGRLLQYLKTALRREDARGSYGGTKIFDRFYTVKDLVQVYLAALKSRAESELGEEITGVVIGRPVKFSEDGDLDHQAEMMLRQAAIDAGFRDVDFELEPIAAALDYERALDGPQNALIFDFGGGTLDIAVMRLGDPDNRRVYASGGVDIAGSDFDRTIIEKRLLTHFGLGRVNHEPDILELIHTVPDWIALPELSTPVIQRSLEKAIGKGIAPVRLQTLQSLIFDDLAFSFYNQVETAKIALSEQGAAVIELKGDDIDVWELYTRAQFEQDIRDYLLEIEKVLQDTLRRSGLEPGEIDTVVKTGGSSSIPAVDVMLNRIFGMDKVKETNAFSSVTAGLAVQAYRKS